MQHATTKLVWVCTVSVLWKVEMVLKTTVIVIFSYVGKKHHRKI